MASCNFLSPIRGEPKVMQRGRFFPEPMLSKSNIVKREAIAPPTPCPVTINGWELLTCISITIVTRAHIGRTINSKEIKETKYVCFQLSKII